ncbi:uncharacterized protein LOC131694065 [Topomyia yanbarensis]|uniref:uncharacterized protein LOC131694065 n=1 Tax=Topomyia yanbarensis TaxID=2498891 RepID=UPI00273CCF14|nr:uncharacterized protein LOC131694065 [Topomyia yanbarensis]
MEVIFTINGKLYKVNPHNVPVDTSLGTFIRKNAQLSGTKMVCREGGCGACIVNVKGEHPVTKERQSRAINSCLFPVYSCHGLDIVTVESVGNKTDGFHAVQRRLAHLNGTQCGFCSPGMVMNMYGLLESTKGQLTMEDVENSFGGNLCRCTGYRPILDAFKSMAIDADPKLIQAVQDIEELPKICHNTGKRCMGSCGAVSKKGIHLVFDDEREWHKVYSVEDVFAILENVGNRTYMLVAGNTAHGVYRRDANIQVFIDINSIEELKFHSVGSNLTVGTNVTLAELIVILNEVASKYPQFKYCKNLSKHIDLIANVPVRSSGTIAGNLCIKNQHVDFPSDLYLIFEAVGAKLTIAEIGGGVSTISVLDICTLNMSKKIVLNVILPPLDSTVHEFRSFKIMPRAQSVHAYINAAFLFKFNAQKWIIETASVCFGGIGSQFTHAVKTEKLMRGKNIFSNEVLQDILSTLTHELEKESPPSKYHQQLAVSLLYRTILSISNDRQIALSSRYQSGATTLHRSLSTGRQEFQTIEKNWPMTKNIPKVEGLTQTAGEAKYIEDLPVIPNELYGALVLATCPRTEIVKIDPSVALQLAGVQAFYSAGDIPGRNDFMPTELDNPETEEIFCSGKVLYYGQPIGIILAETFELAHQAAKLVHISYSETDGKPILPTLKDVLAANATDRLHDQPYDKEGVDYGKIVKPFTKLAGRFELPGQFHFSMEPQTCICVPIEDGMNVYSSTQWVDLCQVAIAQALNIPENSLNFYIRRLGGAFGAKISRASQIACASAIAAHFSQRPVRLVMSLESNMEAIGKRASCVSNYDVEVNENGQITKLLNNYVEDYGCSLNEPVEMVTAQFYKNCYDASCWKLVGKAAVTNSASNTWCRGPGTNEGITMIENIMEHIAHVLDKDPIAVRLENMSPDCKIRELIPEFLNSVEYRKRKLQIDQFNEANRWKKRGIAVVPMQYPQAFFGQMNALVSIYHADGTVSITTGGIDFGQGVNTKITQVAAHVLGIPIAMISIKAMNNLTSPNATVSGGSMTSDAASFAVKKACEILVKRMEPIRRSFPYESWEQITKRCYKENLDLCAMSQYKHGDIKDYSVWGLCCAEVEVDVLTGNLQITRVDILEDTGESISPGIDIGQIEGAFVMGIGLYFTENLIYSRTNGQLLTNRTWNYHLPGAKDIPIDFRVRLLHNTFNENFVLRSKTTGEPALNLTVALLFALRRALNSARKDAGLPKDWYTMVTPSTPEQICLLTGTKQSHFKLH